MNATGKSNKLAIIRGNYGIALLIALTLLALYLTSLYSYLLFHSLTELFSVAIAFGIFAIACCL